MKITETRDNFKNVASTKSRISRKNFLRMALTIIMALFVFNSFAQDYLDDPKANERVIGSVAILNMYDNTSDALLMYQTLLVKAKKEYPNKVIELRNLEYSSLGNSYYSCSAKVVEVKPEAKLNETLVKVIDKAMGNVHDGSRLAIDRISMSGELDRNTIKDKLINILLDKGYKVVAKEYLEKLLEEQEQQNKGNYNKRTTAKTDNFTGVGYFLNIKITEKSIRIQVINVSTSEYEGNATEDF